MTNKILILFFSLFLVMSVQAQRGERVKRDSNTEHIGYKVGDKATDFQMKNVDGNLYSISSNSKAKGYIVIFTSNTCPYAVAYEDRMIELHNKMAPLGYPVVAINSNDPAMEEGDSFDEMVSKHVNRNYPFIYLKDDKDAVYSKFGATKTPHVFLLDKNLIVQYIGAIDDSPRDAASVTINYVENAIVALERGEKPEPNFTKAIGCGIKTKSMGKGKGKGKGRKGPPSPEMMMERMDSNKDNMISKVEAHGPLERDFDQLDIDKDGQLTSAELSKMKQKRGPRKN